MLSAGLIFSDQSHWTLDESDLNAALLWPLFRANSSQSKQQIKMQKKAARYGPRSDAIALENTSDQTQMRSNRLGLDSSAFE